MLEILPLRAR